MYDLRMSSVKKDHKVKLLEASRVSNDGLEMASHF